MRRRLPRNRGGEFPGRVGGDFLGNVGRRSMVTVIDECRSMCCITFVSAPAASAGIAAVAKAVEGHRGQVGELDQPRELI